MPEGGNENLVTIGIDTKKLEQDLNTVREMYVALFKDLESYSNKTVSPLNATGFSELNTSIKQTNEAVGKLAVSLEKLSAATQRQAQKAAETDLVWKKYGQTLDKIENQEAEMQVQQTEAAQVAANNTAQIKENNKALEENARANNADYQARVQNAQAEKDQIDAAKAGEKELERQSAHQHKMSDDYIIQQEAEKVAVNEKRIIAKQIAQEENQMYQDRMKDNAERKAAAEEEKQQIADAIAGEKEANRQEQERIKNSAQYRQTKAEEKVQEQEFNRIYMDDAKAQNGLYQNRMQREEIERNAKKEKAKIDRENAAAAKKNLKDEAKAAEDATKAYDRLKQAVRDAENKYVLQRMTYGRKSPEAKEALKDLTDVRNVMSNVDKELDKARGGAAKFGGAIRGVFGELRTLAYILPGIGIAGIFNKIFEAIGAVIEEMGWFTTSFEKVIKGQQEFAEVAEIANRLWKEQIDLTIHADDANVQYYQRMLNITKATGTNYENQLGDIHNLQQAQKQAAENAVTASDASYQNIAQIDTQLEDLNVRRTITLKNLTEATRVADNIRAKNVLTDEKGNVKPFIPFIDIEKKYVKQTAWEERQDDLKKQLDVEDRNYQVLLSKKATMQQALNNRSDIDVQIKAQQEEEKKFFTDEFRKQRVGDVKRDADAIITEQEKILKNTRSTEQQRIDAILEIRNQNAKKLDIENWSVQKDVGASKVDKELSKANLPKQLAKNTADAMEQVQKVQDEFALRRLEAIKKMAKDEIEVYLKTNEAVMQDQEASLGKRLEAFQNYQEARTAQITLEWEHYKDTLKFKLQTDEEQLAEEKSYQKQLNEVRFSGVAKMRDIMRSYYSEEEKDLDTHVDALFQTTEVQEQYTESLKKLNDAHEKGTISYKKYVQERKKWAEDQTLAQDRENIKDYKDAIEETSKAQEKAAKEQQGNIANLVIAYSTGDQQIINTAKARVDATTEHQEKLNKKMGDLRLGLKKSELQEQEDRDKAQLEGEKQLAANKQEIWNEAFETAQTIADAQFEKRIEQTEKTIALIDKQYDHEIDAIEKSSLAEKDKHALTMQLQAQKERADAEADKKIRKLKHDQALVDKGIAMAQIIWNTQAAITGALKIPVVGNALAITYGILGAIALAKAAATPVPPLAEGTADWRGGTALIGEAGRELVKEPGRRPYYVDYATIKYLPKHTEVIPEYSIPTILERKRDEGWQQTKYLAQIIKASQRKTENKLVNHIHINLGWEEYKKRILYGYNN